ncbi:hypothetical protein [Legionella jordanis]|uniref:Uncharacterized protein n=1 Tax=Legionella jordanis TaxID=456 RepID=A0A0W0VC67_9GAMM|nr:hypothetical protein [Legionella jordanis]KTD17225.1 hypothetical protein Ljor_1531 [Legionella jordanis]RMX03343.1 hypothetical protein EAW55_07965 [Legionella jordanis]RMX15822.1 hypothetical protein EAS68_11320 [Legionella jordanis]VEH12577.1 Uncharacterised protein [Legionella jordanis]HAT8713349.1 hypothetical protein [Legionella jordanis]
MRKFASFIVAILLYSTCSSLNSANRDKEISDLVLFLNSSPMLTPSKSGLAIPLSFYLGNTEDIARYLGDFICRPESSCPVVDRIYSQIYSFLISPFIILGRGLDPLDGTIQQWFEAQAQIERSNLKYGTDIYHAALWQIALALAARNGYLSSSKAKALVNNQLNTISLPGNRATAPLFLYGNQLVIDDAGKAFSFRLLTSNYYNKDPFYGGRYQNFLSWDYNPSILAANDPEGHSPDFFRYISSWSDWKPLTGENAWAQLIAPLQAEYIFNDGKPSSSSTAIKNAINSLYAFSAMQTAVGAFYYAPAGVLDGQGMIPPGLVSIEDNFTVLAGLQILRHILRNTEQTAEVASALHNIDVMLNGGKTINGWETLGLLSFIYNGAFDNENQVFFTQGSINNPSLQNDWSPDTSRELSGMSVNVNLLAISALGVETLDKWFGEGTARNLWRIVRNQGGYFQNDELWGVGYTLNNHTEVEPEDIMSGENSASAINALRMLINYYSGLGLDTQDLEADALSMEDNLINLRSDQYLAIGFIDATPEEFFIKLPKSMGRAYLYASRRFALPFPFLWNANTLASLSATSWVLLNKFDFNPLQYGGKFEGEDYITPLRVDVFDHDNEPSGGALPKTIRVAFGRGDLGPVKKLILSFNLDGSQINWTVAGSTAESLGITSLPRGAEGLQLSFFNGVGWATACQIIPATRICKDNACTSAFTIQARWHSNGRGDCDLTD